MSDTFDRDPGFNFPVNPRKDPDQLLEEVSDPQRINYEKKDSSSDAAKALELLNNVMKAFKTVSEINNSQEEETSEEVESSSTSDNNQLEDTKVLNPAEGSSSKNDEQTSLQPEEKSDQNFGNISDPKLIKRIMDLIRFIPKYRENEENQRKLILKAKHALSKFRSYEEMLSYINSYYGSGKWLGESVFFYYHCVYTLSRPELFNHQFSQNLFIGGNWKSGGGDADEIAEFLDSIPEGNTENSIGAGSDSD